MQPTLREGRRPARPAAFAGFVFALTCFLSPTGPASAQLDPGTRWILLTGTWSRDAAPAPAWFDPSTWTLAAKMEGALPRVASDPEPVPWVPVAGDFAGDGVDTVMMFEPATWRLVRTEDGPVEAAADLEPVPWVPVAGDWDGRGIDTVRVFDLRDGSLHSLAEGPIRVERYIPDPNPWRPLAGDFTGRGFDTVALWRNDEKTGANPDWAQVAGDWDGDGIDTFGVVHVPSGELAADGAAALRFATKAGGGGGAGCWSFNKNYTETIKLVNTGGGVCTYIVHQAWEAWTCCPLTPHPFGPAGCGFKPKWSLQIGSGAC